MATTPQLEAFFSHSLSKKTLLRALKGDGEGRFGGRAGEAKGVKVGKRGGLCLKYRSGPMVSRIKRPFPTGGGRQSAYLPVFVYKSDFYLLVT
jgi:hypothetical protein